MVLESNTLDVLFVKDGQQGEDGKVLYTWIKYAKAANGTGMTDDPDGAIYIGISYNNESSIESNDPTQYAWTKIQGADGKKGEDAYTIFLENENISFATDKNRNPLSEQAYTSGITIMKGAKPVTGFTIGDIAKTQGIAVAKTDTAIAISVVNGNPLPNDSGEIEIPITVGGTVFKKILTWTCAKKGDQGERGLQGIQGPQGEQGIAGKDGTSVTIINKSITYQLSTSGTVIPTGTWQTSPQTIPEGQYQWTKTSVTYSDGNQTESYSISYHGKNGSDGTSVKTTSTSVKYQVGDSGTTKPTGTWQSNVPTVAQGKYLWTQTIVNYSDGNSTESYSVSYRGIDGSNGVNGMNAATIYLYQRATSTPSKPSNTLTYTFSTTKITGTLNNGWSTAIPTGTDAVYVTVASVSSKNDTATITTSAWSTPVVLAQNGKTGSDGKAGLNVATIYLYQRNTSKPSKPSASVTYTFSTGVASGLNNGWSQKIPDGTNPLYVTLATASSNTATDTILSSEWSDVVVMAQNGEDGISPKVSLSKTGGTTTISIVDATGTHTQSVKDGTNGTPGTDGKDGKTSYFHVKYSNDGGKTFTGNSGEDTGIYMGSYTDYTEADSTDVKKYNWVKVKGDKGDTGQKGQDGTSVKITSKSVTYQTSTSGTTAPTGTWVTTVPTVNNGQYLWTKTTVQYSDGNKTEAYSVSYKGTNGTNGTSVTVSKTEVTYQVSTSGTTAPTGTWSTTMPSCDQGQYLWTKTYVKYSDGKDTTSYSVSYKGVDGEKFAFNMLRETNQGSKHWVNMGASGKYSVESITTEDSINAVKLICTEPIASNEWQFCDFSDYEMLKSLKASTTYTLSYDIKTNRSGKILHNIKTGGGQKVFFANDIACKVLGNETWEHVSLKMTSGTTLPNLDGQVIYMFGDALSKVGYSIIKNLKLTEGIIDTPWAPHPEDLEGRGVSETVQYYLATSQASGVTSSTSGWSTDITTQKLTADKKYLWNCYQTKYSDGTSEPISTPKVIGVYGDKGQNAKNLTITPSSQYFKSTDGGKTFTPDTITIKPTIQGEINFGKWQYSIDGGVSFADVMSGQKGLMISNNVLTVSKDSSLYSDAVTMVTFRAVASDSSFYDTCSIAKIYDVSDIGDGRNLLWNSNFAKTDETINTSTYTTWGLILRGSTYTATIDTSVKHNNFNTLKVIGTKAGENGGQDLIYRIKGLNLDEVKFTEIDVKYTLSFYAKASIACNFSARYSYDSYAKDTNVALSTDWKRYEIQMHPTTASYQTSLIFKMDAASTVWFSEFKLEKGSSATGYSTAPEDVQMEILSTKSEISDVSLKVDNNRQAIEQRVEKTTYEQDLNLVKGDISKANEGLNKWRYEIYPKSLFTSEYQGKSTMDVFAKNTNLTPSQSVLINDMDLSIAWNYDNNYIGYALTFAKFSAAKSVAITFAHDDGAHIYLNGKLIGGNDVCNNKGESLTLGFVKGWNCIEVVVNEGASTEGFKLGTTLSALPECQLMNCYYGTPVARQSHITNQLVENTTNIDGISTKVSKVTSVIGEGGENFTSFKNEYSDFKQTMNGFKTTVSQTYVTKDDFNGLEIGGRNLLLYSQTIRAHKDYYGVGWLTDEVETFNGCPVWSVKNQWGRLTWLFKSHVIDRGLVKVGDTLTYSLYAKTNNASGKSINCSYRFKGNANAYWFNGSAFNVGTNWTRYSVTFTITKDMLATDTYMTEIGFEETASMSGDDKVYYACPKLERGTKATDYTPALEDNEINGQNLVSNLSSNWEQGSVSYVANSTYASIKTVLATRLRTEDVFSVSGNVTISAGTFTNSSKEELNFYYVLFDVNKKAIGVPASGSEWQSLTSPKIINCGDAKYMAIILRWGSGSTVITPSNISQICLKIERGTSATPFTLAPEDVNGKIVNVETIANQTADKFSWIVKSGTSSSNFEITDRLMNLVSANINLDGIVSFMNTAKGDGRKNLYNLDYSSFENVASQKDAICYAKDNGVTSVSIDSSVSYDGNKSLKISYTTANLNSSTTPLYLGSSANNYGCVKIQAGKQYLLSCYVKSDSATGLFMIDIQGHDTPDTKTDGLYLSNIDPRKLPGSSTGVNLSTDWQRAICAIKVADNATGLYWSVVPLIWGKPSSSNVPQTFNVWVDCIMLEEVDSISNEPGTYILDKETIIDGGSVKADTITGNQILAGSITADKIATDAIKSHNYISSGGTQGSFLNLGDGSFTSPNLSWDSNGNLIASNANLSGLINATKGTVGGWNIATNGLYSGIDENAIKIYSATTYDAQTMYQKQKIQDSFILSQKYINHFVSQQVSVGHNIPYWQTRSFIYNDSQIQLAQSDYCINTSSASNYDAQYSLKDGYISATRIYMEQNITQVGGDVINSSFSIGLDSMMGWCSIQSTKGINIYGNSSRALYVQSNDTSKYNALETEGDVVVNGKIHAVSGDNKIQLNSDNNGSIELYGNTPFIDFHSAYSSADYTCRIIANTPEQLLVCGKLRCDSNIISNNDLIANSWVYAGQNAHYTWQNQLDCYFSCGYYNNTNNVYYYAGYHAFYVNGDSSSGMMYIDTSGVSSRKGFRNSSDERIKQNFSHFDDNFIDTYMSLEPVQYQFKNDTDDKYHFGFKAQQTERILNAYGQESDKSYGICATHAIDSEKAEKLYGVKDMHEEYTLAYDELIAPTTYMVQHIYKELESTKEELIKVKQEKADLEARLQAIEAKLGL